MKDESARTPGKGPASASRAEGGENSKAGPSPCVPPASVADTPQGKEEKKARAVVADLERQRDEYLELARRTKADFENYRKRVSREASEAEARGRAALATGLLSVVDNLERAMAAAEPRDDGVPNHIAEGIRLVYEELAGVLGNAGVQSYEPVGDQFDPDQHEAMLTRPGNEGQVLEVLQKGYRLNGQVLRPARVVVGAGGEA
jgi:molecular chaperone GrpE